MSRYLSVSLNQTVANEISETLKDKTFKQILLKLPKIATLLTFKHYTQNPIELVNIFKSLTWNVISKYYSKAIIDVCTSISEGVLTVNQFPLYIKSSPDNQKYEVLYIPMFHSQYINSLIQDICPKVVVHNQVRSANLTYEPRTSYLSKGNQAILNAVDTSLINQSVGGPCINQVIVVRSDLSSDFNLLPDYLATFPSVSQVNLYRHTYYDKFPLRLEKILESAMSLPWRKTDKGNVLFLSGLDLVKFEPRSLKDCIDSLRMIRFEVPVVIIVHLINEDCELDFNIGNYDRDDVMDLLKYYNQLFQGYPKLTYLSYDNLDNILCNLKSDLNISYRRLTILVFRELFNFPRIVEELNKWSNAPRSEINQSYISKSPALTSTKCTKCKDGLIKEYLFKIGFKYCTDCDESNWPNGVETFEYHCSLCRRKSEEPFKFRIPNENVKLCQECAFKCHSNSVPIKYRTKCSCFRKFQVHLIARTCTTHFSVNVPDNFTSTSRMTKICTECNKVCCDECYDMLDIDNCYTNNFERRKFCNKCTETTFDTTPGMIKYKPKKLKLGVVKGKCPGCNNPKGSSEIFCSKCEGKEQCKECKEIKSHSTIFCFECESKYSNYCTKCGQEGIVSARRCYRCCLKTFGCVVEHKTCKWCNKSFKSSNPDYNLCDQCTNYRCEICAHKIKASEFYMIGGIRSYSQIHKTCLSKCSDKIKNRFERAVSGINCLNCNSLLSEDKKVLNLKYCTFCLYHHIDSKCNRCCNPVEISHYFKVDKYDEIVCSTCAQEIEDQFPNKFMFMGDMICQGCNNYSSEYIKNKGKIIPAAVCGNSSCISKICFRCGVNSPMPKLEIVSLGGYRVCKSCSLYFPPDDISTLR